MTDYDHTLNELGIMKSDLTEEKKFIARGGVRVEDDHESEQESEHSRPPSS